MDAYVEDKVDESLNGTNFEGISIKKLVSVQVGSALITRKHI